MSLVSDLKWYHFLCVCTISRVIENVYNFTNFGGQLRAISSSVREPPGLSGSGWWEGHVLYLLRYFNCRLIKLETNPVG